MTRFIRYKMLPGSKATKVMKQTITDMAFLGTEHADVIEGATMLLHSTDKFSVEMTLRPNGEIEIKLGSED